MADESSRPTWPAAVVALGFLALVGVFFWRAADSANFAELWAAVGTLVGVVTGAIPSFFFREEAKKASARAEAISTEAPPEAVEAARRKVPRAFY